MSTTFSDLLRPVEEGGPPDATVGLLEAIDDEDLSRLAREDQGAYNFTGSMDQVRAIRIMAFGYLSLAAVCLK
jgi:hypothetical protein